MEKELKITIDQLKNYLGTGLKCHGMGMVEDWDDHPTIPIEFTFTGIFTDANEDIHAEVYDADGNQESIVIDGDLFLLCYRLSDLDKFIPELGFVPLKRLVNDNPKVDNTIEIEFKERKIKSLSSFEITAWIDYESGESRKEHLITFYPFGSQGMTPFRFMENLFQWHFWPFGDEYFEAELVIDKLAVK